MGLTRWATSCREAELKAGRQRVEGSERGEALLGLSGMGANMTASGATSGHGSRPSGCPSLEKPSPHLGLGARTVMSTARADAGAGGRAPSTALACNGAWAWRCVAATSAGRGLAVARALALLAFTALVALPSSALQSAPFPLVNKWKDNKCIGVASPAPSVPLKLYSCDTVADQKWAWRWPNAGRPFALLQLTGTELCVHDGGSTVLNGADCTLQTCLLSDPNMQWYPDDPVTGLVRSFSKPGLCMGDSGEDPNPVHLWDCSEEKANQAFQRMATAESHPFFLTSKPDLCVGVSDYPYEPNLVELVECSYVPNQKWIWLWADAGQSWGRLRLAHANLCLCLSPPSESYLLDCASKPLMCLFQDVDQSTGLVRFHGDQSLCLQGFWREHWDDPGWQVTLDKCDPNITDQGFQHKKFLESAPLLLLQVPNLCVGASGAALGADLKLYSCSLVASQKWVWVRSEASVSWGLLQMTGTDLCISSDGSTLADLLNDRARISPLTLDYCNMSNGDMLWYFHPQGTIRLWSDSPDSGLCFDGGSLSLPGAAPLVLNVCSMSSKSQSFERKTAPEAAIVVYLLSNDGLCIGVDSQTIPATGSTVGSYPCRFITSQKWEWLWADPSKTWGQLQLAYTELCICYRSSGQGRPQVLVLEPCVLRFCAFFAIDEYWGHIVAHSNPDLCVQYSGGDPDSTFHLNTCDDWNGNQYFYSRGSGGPSPIMARWKHGLCIGTGSPTVNVLVEFFGCSQVAEQLWAWLNVDEDISLVLMQLAGTDLCVHDGGRRGVTLQSCDESDSSMLWHFDQSNGGPLRSNSSDLCVDVAGATTGRAEGLRLSACSATETSQQFTTSEDAPVMLKSTAKPSLCTGVKEVAASAPLKLLTCSRVNNQRWVWNSRGGPLRLAETDLCVFWNFTVGGASKLALSDCTAIYDRGSWVRAKLSNQWSHIQPSKDDTICMDDGGALAPDSREFQLATCNDWNQDQAFDTSYDFPESDQFLLASKWKNSLCLGATSRAPASLLKLYGCDWGSGDNSNNQRWSWIWGNSSNTWGMLHLSNTELCVSGDAEFPMTMQTCDMSNPNMLWTVTDSGLLQSYTNPALCAYDGGSITADDSPFFVYLCADGGSLYQAGNAADREFIQKSDFTSEDFTSVQGHAFLIRTGYGSRCLGGEGLPDKFPSCDDLSASLLVTNDAGMLITMGTGSCITAWKNTVITSPCEEGDPTQQWSYNSSNRLLGFQNASGALATRLDAYGNVSPYASDKWDIIKLSSLPKGWGGGCQKRSSTMATGKSGESIFDYVDMGIMCNPGEYLRHFQQVAKKVQDSNSNSITTQEFVYSCCTLFGSGKLAQKFDNQTERRDLTSWTPASTDIDCGSGLLRGFDLSATGTRGVYAYKCLLPSDGHDLTCVDRTSIVRSSGMSTSVFHLGEGYVSCTSEEGLSRVRLDAGSGSGISTYSVRCCTYSSFATQQTVEGTSAPPTACYRRRSEYFTLDNIYWGNPIENLESGTVWCGSAERLQGFKINRAGDDSHYYSYTCCRNSRKASASVVVQAKTDQSRFVGDESSELYAHSWKPLQDLDVSCTYGMLQGFQFYYNQGSPFYQDSCIILLGDPKTICYSKNTRDDGGGGYIIFLDRHTVQCDEPSHHLARFSLSNVDDNSMLMGYDYTCCYTEE